MGEMKKLVTPVFRASFPELFEAKSFDGGKPKFGLSAVWTPAKFSASDKKRWAAIMAALDEASMDRFKKKWDKLPANFKTGVRDGAEKADLEGYGEGTMFANITSMMRPGVVDVEKHIIAKDGAEREKLEADGKDVSDKLGSEAIYPGCYMRATVTVYSYDNKGKGVALGLQNVQKVADGERLDSRTNAEDDFDDDVDERWLDEGEETAADPLD